MFPLSNRSGLALLLAALCLSGPTAHAQANPLTYWTPGWPVGLSGSDGQNLDGYGNFPGFDGSDAGGFSYRRYSFPNGLFVGGERGGMGLGLNGIGQYGAFGNIGSLSYEGMQFGYKFKNAPLAVYGGFDTLKYDAGIGGPFTAFDSTSSAQAGYSAHAGVEYQAAPNVSLSLGVGYTNLQSGRVDSDINSPLPPGASPFAFGARR
jgi:opacity protein-like surface antigen